MTFLNFSLFNTVIVVLSLTGKKDRAALVGLNCRSCSFRALPVFGHGFQMGQIP